MPAVRLTRYECQHNLLPRVCTRCGAPAEGGACFTLLTPTWNLILGLVAWFCAPVIPILIPRLKARRSFVVPMCEPHRADWQWRDRLTDRLFWYLVIPVYVATALAVLLLLLTETRMLLLTETQSEVLGSLPLIYLATVWGWIVTAMLVLMRTVRVMRVQPRWIELWGVRRDFIRALIDDRIRTRESDPERLGSYGDVRDDFEEQWYDHEVLRADQAGRPNPAGSGMEPGGRPQ
jgi:hypothetical protein